MADEPDATADHVRQNRALWDARSDWYQRENAPQLNLPRPAWGVWHLLADDSEVLGDVREKTILELGCGAAQWSIALAKDGAHPVGLDASSRQLEHARRFLIQAGLDVPLVHADAEHLPFRDRSFDTVFCEWGAMTFADPYRTVPEAARVLRPNGLLAFCTSTPFDAVCWSELGGRVEPVLHRDYFGMHAIHDAGDGMAQFQLPYGDWIRLFRRHGLVVEDLIELQPPMGATSTYRDADDLAWARRWPMENIWKVRKVAQR